MTRHDSAAVEMSGIIDLVVCTATSYGQSAIRAVDLKTEDAGSMDADSPTGLIEALGSEDAGPANEAEVDILTKHGLQLALYYRALKSIEDARAAQGMPSRLVLPPAILVGVTGRIIEIQKRCLRILSQTLMHCSRGARGWHCHPRCRFHSLRGYLLSCLKYVIDAHSAQAKFRFADRETRNAQSKNPFAQSYTQGHGNRLGCTGKEK